MKKETSILNKEIKGILFDLDNTLIDFMTMKKKCTRTAISAMIDAGLPLGKRDAYSKLMKMYNEFGIEDQSIYQKFLKKYHKLDYKILSAGIVAYRKEKILHLVPYKNVRKTLSALKRKGLKIGVVSDAPRLQVWLRLTAMKLVNYFDVVLGFEDTGKLKPSAVPFRKALSKMKLKPFEVVFVGDNPRRDITGAKKVGMSTVLAQYGCNSKLKNSENSITHIEELLKL
ncbi:HAD-IA family hydrolase [Nanoarchaeota archaeon]